jgi:hypothetical protein
MNLEQYSSENIPEPKNKQVRTISKILSRKHSIRLQKRYNISSKKKCIPRRYYARNQKFLQERTEKVSLEDDDTFVKKVSVDEMFDDYEYEHFLLLLEIEFERIKEMDILTEMILWGGEDEDVY